MPDLYTSESFENQFTYTGTDLGAVYTKDATTLRIWAPTASAVAVNLYSNGDPQQQPAPVRQVTMAKDIQGTWISTLSGDCHGTYYTYLVDGREACDPYARTTGINGHRAMIIDLDSTNPRGWETDRDPHAGDNFTDAVIYELHIRDLSMDPSSGIQNAGKYLGLTETGTKNTDGISTGLDHMKNLGVTHIHLLPMYDFGSVDERIGGFNWGYDPVNYNVPEGSYATDPYHGEVRVRECKQMVKALHDNGLSIIMDVVYNHVFDAETFCMNQIVPGYFSRPNSNGSGCGNDTASERSMVSKYIVDSVKYWADEYHIDGFRFDLVGLIDTDTVNALMQAVHETHPNVKFYGEGWSIPTAVTKENCHMTTQTNAGKVPGFAFFNDSIRDALKGSVFDKGTGFVSGAYGKESAILDALLGQSQWGSTVCPTPLQTINYASCHDNNTLMDRITMSTPWATWEDRVKMNRLAAAIYMLSQGVPFIHAGEEMLRSKPKDDGTFEENSYNSGDAVNAIRWNLLGQAAYRDTFRYYQGLIAFRKAHPVLRLTNPADVNACSARVSGTPANVVALQVGDLFLVFNANSAQQTISLPEGSWNVCIDGEQAGTKPLYTASGSICVDAISATVLVKA